MKHIFNGFLNYFVNFIIHETKNNSNFYSCNDVVNKKKIKIKQQRENLKEKFFF